MKRSEFVELAQLIMGTYQTLSIYPADHPRVGQMLRELYLRAAETLAEVGEARIVVADQEFLIAGSPLVLDGGPLASLHELLRAHGVGRLIIRQGVRRWELREFVRSLARGRDEIDDAGGMEEVLTAAGVEHIQAGAMPARDVTAEMSAALPDLWQMKVAGVDALRSLRDRIGEGHGVDMDDQIPEVAHSLADAASRHGDDLLLLQDLQSHDEYSYTHSLNVALLSVTIARHLGLRESDLREVAMAALLHDVGKESVPLEILNKAGKLTPEERDIMRQHGPDGAKMLIANDEVSDLSVLVAYEHHLANEKDSPDYERWPLHVVSQLVSIADVYDALRSTRPYRAAIPADRAMQIMEQPGGDCFDAELFDLFRRLVGYYPPGTVLRLNEGSTAISLAAHPEEPELPRVLVLRGPDGSACEPLEAELTEFEGIGVAEILDAEAVGIDPFDYL